MIERIIDRTGKAMFIITLPRKATMKNWISLETAEYCTECGLEICVWIEKVLRPLAIGGGFILVAAMLWKAVTA